MAPAEVELARLGRQHRVTVGQRKALNGSSENELRKQVRDSINSKLDFTNPPFSKPTSESLPARGRAPVQLPLS
jgi:hypothetical protein